MTVTREGHSCTQFPNGKFLIAGGQDEALESAANEEIYDPAVGTFSPTAGMKVQVRALHTATRLPNV